jgi:hypothetical protein
VRRAHFRSQSDQSIATTSWTRGCLKSGCPDLGHSHPTDWGRSQESASEASQLEAVFKDRRKSGAKASSVVWYGHWSHAELALNSFAFPPLREEWPPSKALTIR